MLKKLFWISQAVAVYLLLDFVFNFLRYPMTATLSFVLIGFSSFASFWFLACQIAEERKVENFKRFGLHIIDLTFFVLIFTVLGEIVLAFSGSALVFICAVYFPSYVMFFGRVSAIAQILWAFLGAAMFDDRVPLLLGKIVDKSHEIRTGNRIIRHHSYRSNKIV